MNSRKSAVASAIGFAIAGASLSANATLTTTNVLTFNNSTGNASFFTMGVDPVNNITITTAINIFATSAGGGLQLGIIDLATGSHSGTPDGSETPAIDTPWGFFGNTGMHQLTSASTVVTQSGTSAQISLVGWNVNWNGISSIPMGGDPTNFGAADTGIATLTCSNLDLDGTCDHGDTYTLGYAAHVPVGDASGFGGVQYGLHLEGAIRDPSVTAPIANADRFAANAGSTAISLPVLANDEAPAGIKADSLAIVTQAAQGNAAANLGASPDTVNYTPPTAFAGDDTFTYRFQDNGNTNSNDATVTVEPNAAPVADDDTAGATAVNGLTTDIAVLAGDTDANDDTANGGIAAPPDQNSVVISDDTGLTSIGSVVVRPDGKVRFTSNGNPGSGTFKYRAVDKLGTQSNEATVTVNAAAQAGDFAGVPPGKFALLTFDPGTAPATTSDPSSLSGVGSYFTMLVDTINNVFTVTNLRRGPAGGIVLDREQPGAASHSDTPTGNEVTGVDNAWGFFGNTGLHFTKNGGIGIKPNGTLDFFDKWFVSWNSIPAINMGGSPIDPVAIRGIASIDCGGAADSTCDDGDSYELVYDAHVPDGDPSGFSNVAYGLRLVGNVRFIDDAVSASAGTITFNRESAQDLNQPDTGTAFQCVGDCVSFDVSGVPAGGQVEVTFALAGGVPQGAVYRKFKDGAWKDFDTSTGDAVMSAPLPPIPATNCAGAGPFVSGLVEGNTCIKLLITDGGPNDTNAATGVVGDPGGVGISSGAAATPPVNLTSFTDGCSIAGRDLSLTDRGGWLAVLGFIGGLAFWRRRQRMR